MTHLLKKFILIQVLMLIALFGYNQTYITSNITTNTLWSDPYYIVQTDVTINANCTLTIEDGGYGNSQIIIEIENGNQFTVLGQINANGTSSFPIIFTAADPGTGWDGIDISSNNSSNSFDYCTFEYVIKNPACSTNFASCGAVYLNSSSNTSFDNCTFRYNTVCNGGGIACLSSKLMVDNSLFHDNFVQENGGALYVENASNLSYLNNSIIQENFADYGGGIYFKDCNRSLGISANTFSLNESIDGAGVYFNNVISSLTYPIVFRENQLSDNEASNNGGGMYINSSDLDNIASNLLQSNIAEDGAGIYVNDAAISDMNDNKFEGNTANNNGGALVFYQSYVNLVFGIFTSNSANNFGGGIYIEGSHGGGNPNNIINCLIVDNVAYMHGGGIYSNNFFLSYSNTITDNISTTGQGGGIYHNFCNSTMMNTINWNNTAGSNSNAFPDPDGNNGYSYSCTTPISNCVSCVSSNPDFVGNGDYNLSYNTSCRNVGDNSAQQTNYDLDVKDRILDHYIDIGAYEDPKSHKSGQVAGTWTNLNPDGVDYVIDGDIYVPSGYTLNIDEGTEVVFNGAYKFDIVGTLNIAGEPENLVTLTSTPGNTWNGIRFVNNSNSSVIDYCDISNIDKTSNPACSILHQDYSGAIYIENSTLTISNSKIHNNEVCDNGGAIFITNSSPIIKYNEIYSNTANRSGGGIAINSGAPQIYNNFIEDNDCIYDGGGIFTASSSNPNPKIENNLITNNYANQNGGGVFMDDNSTTEIYNCTVADNTANGGNGGGFYNATNSTITSTNNIIWGNTAFNSIYNHVYIGSGCSSAYSYCCSDYVISGWTYCTTSNPNFIAGGDYSITYTSSCFNIGNNSITPPDNVDLKGYDRILDNYKIDVGAYEVQTSVKCSNVYNTSSTPWTDQNPDGIDYLITCDIIVPSGNTLFIEEGTTIAFDGFYQLDVEGTLDAQGGPQNYITFKNSENTTGWSGINFGVNNSSTSQSYGGTSDMVYCNIRNIDKSAGTGSGIDDNTVSGSIFIYDNGSANITIDNCNIHDNIVPEYGGGILCYSCSPAIDIKNSFIYLNEAGLGGGGIGIYNFSDPKVHHNLIDNNSTSTGDGGGIYIYDGCMPDIFHNYIKNNTCYNEGGGIYIENSCDPMIYNNLIYINSADNGGGIYIGDNSNPFIYSCTIADNIADNQAGNAGGVYFETSCTPEFRNTIAWWNIPSLSDVKKNGVNADADEYGLYDYCAIRNFSNSPSGSNYDDDPNFVDHSNSDYRLSRINNSQYFDVGSSSFYKNGLSTYDIKGNPRITDCHASLLQIDIGAYEYEGSGDCNNPTQDGLYKIKQSDSISFKNESFSFIVYPNPTDQWFVVQYYSYFDEDAVFTVFNSIGRIVWEKRVQSIVGENYFIFESDKLVRGLYFLQSNSKSLKSETVKLIVE